MDTGADNDDAPVGLDARGCAGPLPPARQASGGRPAHAVRPLPRLSRVAAGAGIAAGLAAIGLGTAALLRTPPPIRDIGPTLRPITVSTAPTVAIPLSVPEMLALLDRPADFGSLADPQRRASCLSGLGYPPSARVLGARPIQAGRHSGLLLLLPGEQAGTVVALAVAANCSSVDTGLFADTTVRRP